MQHDPVTRLQRRPGGMFDKRSIWKYAPSLSPKCPPQEVDPVTIPSFHLTVYDDSGSVYLACRTCTWEVEILDWGLDSINDEAAEHQAQAHPS